MYFPFKKADKSGIFSPVANNGAWGKVHTPRIADGTLILRSTTTPASNYVTLAITKGYTGEIGNHVYIAPKSTRVEIWYAPGTEAPRRIYRSTGVNGLDLTKFKALMDALSLATEGIEISATITGSGVAPLDLTTPNGEDASRAWFVDGDDGGETLCLVDIAHPNTVHFCISEDSTDLVVGTKAQYLRSATSGSPYMFHLGPTEYLYARASGNAALTNGMAVEEYHFPRGTSMGGLFAGFTPQGMPAGAK